MSCAACESKATSCTNQAESAPSRSHYTSDTEDSNMCDSGYTSDMPSGEEFISEQDDCCNDNGGDCPGTAKPPKSPQMCQQSKPEPSDDCCSKPQEGCVKPQQESRPPQQNRPRRCSCSAAENQQQRQSQPQCPRQQSQCPSSNSKSSAKGAMLSQLNAPRVGSISQPYTVAQVGSNVSSRKSMAQSNSYFQQPTADSQVQFNSFPQTQSQQQQQPACGGMACNTYGNQGAATQPMASQSYVSNGQNQGLKSCLNNQQQDMKPMSSNSSRNFSQRSNGSGCNSEPPKPKQVVAQCCYQNKSMQSLTSKNSRAGSQSTAAPGSGTKTTCCDKQPDTQADAFVCPSCAEFENVEEDIKTCDEPEEKPQMCPSDNDCCADDSDDCGQGGNAADCPSQFGTEHTQEKSKKKGSNSGFWQQLQFQIFQQQDGDEDEGESDQKNNGNDQYLCGSNQNNSQVAEKQKKSGNKVWQQLTLDIFQSKEDESDGESGESNSRQGWQQQLKLQIFQEKVGSDGEEEPNELQADTGNDQYVC